MQKTRTLVSGERRQLIWLTIVLAIVFVADRVISRVLRKILDNSQIPSASIVNLTRVTI